MKGIKNKERALAAVGVIVFYGWVFALIYLPEFRFRDALLSAWLILATGGVIIGRVFIRLAERKTGRIFNWRFCRRCGYNLRGNLSGACPECGEKIPDAIVRNLARENSAGAQGPMSQPPILNYRSAPQEKRREPRGLLVMCFSLFVLSLTCFVGEWMLQRASRSDGGHAKIEIVAAVAWTGVLLALLGVALAIVGIRRQRHLEAFTWSAALNFVLLVLNALIIAML